MNSITYIPDTDKQPLVISGMLAARLGQAQHIPLMAAIATEDAESYMSSLMGYEVQLNGNSPEVYWHQGQKFYRVCDVDAIIAEGLFEGLVERVQKAVDAEKRKKREQKEEETAKRDKEIETILAEKETRKELSREDITDLATIILGEATIKYLVLGNASPLAEQYAEVLYQKIQEDGSLWPLDGKKIDGRGNGKRKFIETYQQYQTERSSEALLNLYKENLRVLRGYIALVGAYLRPEKQEEEKEEKQEGRAEQQSKRWELPCWKFAWNDLQRELRKEKKKKQKGEQKEMLLLNAPKFQEYLSEGVKKALQEGYAQIHYFAKRAVEIIVNKHQQFAWKEANKYRFLPLSEEDIFQEAQIGIVRAAERYDYTQKNKEGQPIGFRTYAKWWTRAAICRAADETFGLKITHNMLEKIRKIWKINDRLKQQYEEEPSRDVLREEALLRLPYSEETIDNCFRTMELMKTDSLDEVILDGGKKKTRHEVVTDQHAVAIDENTVTRDFRRRVMERITILLEGKYLTEREVYVIERRYLYNPHEEEQPTLTDVGEGMGLSRERVRQLEGKALRTLRQRLGDKPIIAHPQ